ncbi:MAG: ABC transporter permease [Micrococcales bacterium]|nr:ABC transporter permease [Micrococcales bacterium]
MRWVRYQWQWLTDLVGDVTTEMDARRSKTVLLLVAVTLSTGALVASVGISQTAQREIDAGLAASTLDLVAVSPAGSVSNGGPSRTFPADAPRRAAGLDLVLATGTRLDITGTTTTIVSRRQVGTPGGQEVNGLTVAGMTSGYLDALRAPEGVELRFLLDSEQRVVLLGATAAEQLGVPTSGDLTGVTIWINGEQYAVVGSLSAPDIDLARTVAIPYEIALAQAGNDSQAQLLVRTAPGAGAPVADVVRLAVLPAAPERLSSSLVVDVTRLRAEVSGAFDKYIAGAGVFLLGVTVLLIANSMIVQVTSRTAEIGLRRAMGASAWDIAILVLCEGAVLGCCGGVGGAAVAASTVAVVAWVNGWTVVQPLLALAAGPVLGATAGVLSCLPPAATAARVQPAVAVRTD